MKRNILLILIMILLLLVGCNATMEDSSFVEEKKDITEYELNLPEEYYIEVEVIRSSGFGKQKTTYCLSESSDGWIYMKLGSDSEQCKY